LYNLDFVKYGLLLTIVLFLNTMPNKEINRMNKKNYLYNNGIIVNVVLIYIIISK
jgi:hypothetical protein